MQDFLLQPTRLSPMIKANAENGTIEFIGNAFQLELWALKAFKKWMEDFWATEPTTITFSFRLNAFNTSFSQVIQKTLSQAKKYRKKHEATIQVVWHYEKGDESGLEDGEDFEEIVALPFQYVAHEKEITWKVDGTKFLQKETHSLPEIEGDISKSTIRISGKAIPPDLYEFSPMVNWAKDFFQEKHNAIAFIVSLEFANNVFYRFLNDLFVLANKANEKNGAQVFVIWHYEKEDETMLGDGKEFQDTFSFDFSFVEGLN